MNSKRILLIEDDDAHAKLMTIAFNKHCNNCEIIHIKDGLEAVSWLEKAILGDWNNLPRLILLDLNIPGINGLEVLKKIKKDKILRLLPVVILTTSSSNNDIKTCYEEKANSYLIKPIVFNEYSVLMGKIKEYWLDSSMAVNAEYI